MTRFRPSGTCSSWIRAGRARPSSWNDAGSTADLGSLTDATYGIIAPLVDGVTSIMDETELDPGAC